MQKETPHARASLLAAADEGVRRHARGGRAPQFLKSHGGHWRKLQLPAARSEGKGAGGTNGGHRGYKACKRYELAIKTNPGPLSLKKLMAEYGELQPAQPRQPWRQRLRLSLPTNREWHEKKRPLPPPRSCHSCDSWATDLVPLMSGATSPLPFVCRPFPSLVRVALPLFPKA